MFTPTLNLTITIINVYTNPNPKPNHNGYYFYTYSIPKHNQQLIMSAHSPNLNLINVYTSHSSMGVTVVGFTMSRLLDLIQYIIMLQTATRTSCTYLLHTCTVFNVYWYTVKLEKMQHCVSFTQTADHPKSFIPNVGKICISLLMVISSKSRYQTSGFTVKKCYIRFV